MRGARTAGRSAWLARALGALGVIEQAPFDPVAIVPKIASLAPSLVFIDFGAAHAFSGSNGNGHGGPAAASAMTAAARDAFPGLAIVALGSLAESSSALAALRAGVRDFVGCGR